MKSQFASLIKFIPLALFVIFGIALLYIGASLFISSGSIDQLKSIQTAKAQQAKELLGKTNELAEKLSQFDQERQELEALIAKLSNLAK